MKKELLLSVMLLAGLSASAQGVAPIYSGCEDITIEKFHEADNFARTEETLNSGRFGAPKYWTVENFGFGDQAGIDNATGTDCLHFEIWWNGNAFAEHGYDIQNVRIYQQVTLPAGRYYFGAVYPSTEANDDSYLFVSDTLVNTCDIPTMSIGCEKIKGAVADGSFYGFYFTLDSEKSLYFGIQSDLSSSTTNSVRVQAIKLLSYGNINHAKLQELVGTVEEQLAGLIVNENTGFYSKQMYDEVVAIVAEAKNVAEDADYDTIKSLYDGVNAAFDNLMQNGKNVGAAPEETDATDLTIEKLSEADNFARTEATLNSGRFGAPKYWTVENYGFGDQAGLDSATGTDCLHLEIWWNGNAFAEHGYDIHNARIYQKVSLPAGRYCFAAMYPTAESNDVSYIFASENVLNTSDIPTQSIAYERVNMASADGTYRGIYFSLDTPMEVCLGFQADFSASNTNNIRVEAVKLLSYGSDSSIESPNAATVKEMQEIYTLTGQRLSVLPTKGIFIINGRKVIVK